MESLWIYQVRLAESIECDLWLDVEIQGRATSSAEVTDMAM